MPFFLPTHPPSSDKSRSSSVKRHPDVNSDVRRGSSFLLRGEQWKRAPASLSRLFHPSVRALSLMARLARRRIVGFDSWGRHLTSGPRAADQEEPRAHPPFLQSSRAWSDSRLFLSLATSYAALDIPSFLTHGLKVVPSLI